MSLYRIRNLLNARLATSVSVNVVAWENVAYTPDPTTTHYRVNFLPAPTRAAANHRSAMNFESGIYQIDIFVPQNNGTKSADETCETIRALFYRGLTLTDSVNNITVNIAQTPSLIINNRDGPFWRMQLDVPWFSYVPLQTS